MTNYSLILQLFFIIILITIVYRLGRLVWALIWGIHHKHYFLVFGPKLFTISVKGVKFSYGFSIPFFGKRHVYNFENGQKEHGNMPWEFYEFPKRQRLITTLGGIFSLLLFGILTFIILAYTETTSFITKEEVNRLGVYPTELSAKAGFQLNDKIIAFNNKDYENFFDLTKPVEGTSYTILRNGKTFDIKISKEISEEVRDLRDNFLFLNAPFTVDQIEPFSPAQQAGIKIGDCIKSVNGKPIVKIFDLKKELAKDKDGESEIVIERLIGTHKKTFTTTVKPTEYHTLGFVPKEQINFSYKKRSIGEAILLGTKNSFEVIQSNVYGFYVVLGGNIPKTKSLSGPIQTRSISGPIAIASRFGAKFNWHKFWSFTAIYFILIAFYNTLPLPGSAFWEVIPLAYEKFLKKRYTFNQYMSTRKLAIWIIVSLMILSFVNDLMKIFN